MIVLFITISLMLNIFAFIAIIILYLRQNKLIKMDERQKNMIKEMEELMSTYLLEMKEENQQFIHHIQVLREEQAIVPALFDEKVQAEIGERKITYFQDEKDKDIQQRNLRKTAGIHAIKAYQKQKTVEEETIDAYFEQPLSNSEKRAQEHEERGNQPNQSLLEKVKSMEKQGNSIEEIAKKLNKGKTEIELLLKLQENM